MALEHYQFRGEKFPIGAEDPQTTFAWLNQLWNPWSQTNRATERILDGVLGDPDNPQSVTFRHDDTLRPAFCGVVRARVQERLDDLGFEGINTSVIQPAPEELSPEEQVDAIYERLVEYLERFRQPGSHVDQIFVPMSLIAAVNKVIRGGNFLRDNLAVQVIQRLAKDSRFVFDDISDLDLAPSQNF